MSAFAVLSDGEMFRYPPKLFSFLASTLRARLLEAVELEFVAYWGIGSKECPGVRESIAIDFHRNCLAALASAVDLPWKLEFIFTDTHAEINNKPPESADKYIESMSSLLEQEGFGSSRMSSVLQALGLSEYWKSACAESIDNPLWQDLRAARRKELERLAQRHSTRNTAAAEYLVSNIIEGSALSIIRPRAFFVTFMLPSMSYLLPPLPIIHIFTGPGRMIERPWFVSEPCTHTT